MSFHMLVIVTSFFKRFRKLSLYAMKAHLSPSIRIFVFVFIFFMSKYQVTNCGEISVAERKCKEDLFPKPYVVLKSNKNGREVNKLETQGIMDLREAIDAYLCINGAVIIYGGVSSHMEPKDNNTNSTEVPTAEQPPFNAENDHKNGTGSEQTKNSEDESNKVGEDESKKVGEGEEKKNETHETPHPHPTIKIKHGETLRFSNGAFKMFTHKCMHINRISKREQEKMMNNGEGKPVIGSDTTVAGVKATGIFLVASKEPYSPGGPPLKIMFNRKAFGYKVGTDERLIKDVSFVAVGKGPFCISLKDGSKIVMNSTAEGDKEICRWTVNENYRRIEEGKMYLKLIKVARDKDQYTWEDCPSDALEDKNNENKSEIENNTIIPRKQSPFAINKPGSSGGQGHQNNKMFDHPNRPDGVSGFHREGDQDVSSQEFGDMPYFGRKRRMSDNNQTTLNNDQSKSMDDQNKPVDKNQLNEDKDKSTDDQNKSKNDPIMTTNEQEQPTNIGSAPAEAETGSGSKIKYFIQLKDCVTPPEFDPKDPLCEFIKEDNLSCEKLSTAMELEEGDGNAGKGSGKIKRRGEQKRAPDDQNQGQSSSSGSSSSEGPLTLGGNPLLKWKDEVLHTVAKIFTKICIPIKEQSVFTLIKVIGNYIATAHTDNPEASEEYGRFLHKTNLWDILISSLERCCQSNKTVPMHWRWSENIKVPSNSGNKRKRRTKRRVLYAPSKSNAVLAKTLMLEDVRGRGHVNVENLEDADDKPKLIIQRSPSVFDFDDDDERTNEMVYGTIPKIKRQADQKNISVAIPIIQEYVPVSAFPTDDEPSPSYSSNQNQRRYEDYMFHPDPSRLRIHGFADKQIFYYEDEAQYMMDLNKVIDAFWKVLATVLGFCQMTEISRGNAMFPLLLHNFEEYFLNMMKDQWKNPAIEQEVDMVMGEFMDDDRGKWLDTCLETAYIMSDSLQFRPARPVDVFSMESDSGKEGSKMKPNGFIETPETMPGGDRSYFTRNVKIKG